MKLRLTLAATSAVLTFSSFAAAQQPWLSDSRYGNGIGIRTGNFELHPSIAAELGYDSNYFQRAETEPPIEDAFRLRVTPALTLSTLTDERLRSETAQAEQDFRMQASLYASYNEFFGSEEIVEQRHLDAGVGLRIDIAPRRQFGADLYGDFVRQGEPSNLADTNEAFDRGTARGGAGISWRPGGGLFDWRVGYEGAYNYFEDEIYKNLNNVQHTINTRGRWRFLPRSALLYDAEYTMTRYSDEDSPQPNGDDLQARVGFSGLITRQLAFLGLLGWNSSFYEGVDSVTPPQDYDGYVAQAELKYFIQQGGSSDSARVGVSSVALGFIRDFSNSYLGAFYVRDRGYMKFDYFLGNKFVASLEGGFARYSYPRISEVQGSFEQSRIDARLFAEYRLSDIVGLNTTLMYDQAIGGDNIVITEDNPATMADESATDDLEYSRFQAYLGMRVFW
jgi:putative beta-barrel porin BBP2